MKKLALLVICIAGALMISYPLYANLLYSLRADNTIELYRETVSGADEVYSEALKQAEQYNQRLASGQIALIDPFSQENEEDLVQYNQLLWFREDGMMGILRIPCIDVELPIYHGTETRTLSKGVGHLSGTSLPVGGESTHAVLTGHTGLSGARMFTDLSEMEIGDLFFVEVADREMAYRVVDISVVEPTDLSKLSIEQGKDLVTLVTCTPYGVNTHRLLVRGRRTELTEEENGLEAEPPNTISRQWEREYIKALAAGGLLMMLMMFGGRAVNRRKRGRC